MTGPRYFLKREPVRLIVCRLAFAICPLRTKHNRIGKGGWCVSDIEFPRRVAKTGLTSCYIGSIATLGRCLLLCKDSLSAPRPVNQAMTCTLPHFSCCASERIVVGSLLHCDSGRILLAASVNQDLHDASLQLWKDHCFTMTLEEIYPGEAWTQGPASLRLWKDHCFTTTLKAVQFSKANSPGEIN